MIRTLGEFSKHRRFETLAPHTQQNIAKVKMVLGTTTPMARFLFLDANLQKSFEAMPFIWLPT